MKALCLVAAGWLLVTQSITTFECGKPGDPRCERPPVVRYEEFSGYTPESCEERAKPERVTRTEAFGMTFVTTMKDYCLPPGVEVSQFADPRPTEPPLPQVKRHSGEQPL